MIKPISLVETKKLGAQKLEPIKVPSFKGGIDYNKLNKTFERGVDVTADYLKKGMSLVIEKAPDAIETGKKCGKKALEISKSAIESTYKFFQELSSK